MRERERERSRRVESIMSSFIMTGNSTRFLRDGQLQKRRQSSARAVAGEKQGGGTTGPAGGGGEAERTQAVFVRGVLFAWCFFNNSHLLCHPFASFHSVVDFAKNGMTADLKNILSFFVVVSDSSRG